MFKVGDVVVVIPEASYSITKPGSWGIVLRCTNDSAYVDFKHLQGYHGNREDRRFTIYRSSLAYYKPAEHPFNRVVEGI